MREAILTLGKYEILDAIGSGGMATVYRARVTGPMGFEKPAAVKVLQDDAAADSDIVRMFIDEARLGARLTHPNIVSVLDFGETEGRYFMAMEYVEGPSLSTLLKGGPKGRKGKPLPVATAAFVTRGILRALAYAHEAPGPDGKPLGIVHRDVSPHNVLLDRSGTVKLCDFGIATGAYRADQTRAGVVKGKAGYMSPEQAAGGRVDARSDLYSTGLTLFAMLTGTRAFEGKDTTEIRRNAAEGVDPARIDGLDAPDALKSVLRVALAMRPIDRFQRAEEFAMALLQAVPDLEEAGRTALVEALAALPAGATRTRASEKRKNAPPRSRTLARASKGEVAGTAPDPAGGIRNLLILAGAVVLLALLLALLGVGMPEGR